MIVLCINCQNFNLQAAGRDWAVIGFGQCEVTTGRAHKSARYSRECDNFISAPDGVAEKRREWLDAKMTNDLGNRRAAGPIGGASVLTDVLCGNGSEVGAGDTAKG